MIRYAVASILITNVQVLKKHHHKYLCTLSGIASAGLHRTVWSGCIRIVVSSLILNSIRRNADDVGNAEDDDDDDVDNCSA